MPAAAIALLIGAPGFSQIRTSVAAPPSSAAGKTGPRTARKSDAEIEKAIRAKLAKSKIDADHFNVRVQGGVATISGTTNVIQHKGVATRLAKGAGAIRVANNIQIRQTTPGKTNPSLATGLKRAEIQHSNAGPASPSTSLPTFGSSANGALIGAQNEKSDMRSVPASTDQPAAGSTAGSGLKRVQIVKRGDARSDSNLASQPAVVSSARSAQSR
jgi:BON domain